jgi:hypothetical protein
MARRPTFRQLLVSILALWRDLNNKEIGAPDLRFSSWAFIRRTGLGAARIQAGAFLI